MLHKFWVVTRSFRSTSIYEVTDYESYRDKEARNYKPIARKVKLKGESPVEVGRHLSPAPMLAIGRRLQMYQPSRYQAEPKGEVVFERDYDRVTEAFLGARSSAVVAAFLEPAEAYRCFGARNPRPFDVRWQRQTLAVIDAIGHAHPVFCVSSHPEHDLRQVRS